MTQVAGHDALGRREGIVRTLSALLAEDGFMGLFKGLRIKLVQSVLATALMFVLKERLNDAASSMLQPLAPARVTSIS
jgi:Mitochondrial carrier protein